MIDHFQNRVKIHNKVAAKARSTNTRLDTTLNEVQSRAMDQMFHKMIDLREKEGFDKNRDDCHKNIEKARSEAMRNGNWRNTVEYSRKAMGSLRSFNVNLFLTRYNEYKMATRELKNQNVVLFIGSTGAGKSTTIYFLKGVADIITIT